MLSRSTVARALVLVLGLGVAASACGQYSISNIRALQAFKDGNTLYQKGEYKAAAERYQACFEHNPGFKGIAYFFLGNSYDNLYKPTRAGEPENDEYLRLAIENYKLAIDKIRDDDATGAADVRRRAYEYLIAAYTDKLKDITLAEPVARRLIELDVNEPTNYQLLGKLYQDAGRYEEAEAQFLKAAEVRPNDPQVYATLATFYNDQGKFDKTMEALGKRAQTEPNSPEAWYTMGTYYAHKVLNDKQLPKAKQAEYVKAGLEAEDKALAINHEYVEAMVFKGILLRLQASLESNLTRRNELMKQAEDIRTRALELQQKQNAGTGDPKKGKGGQ